MPRRLARPPLRRPYLPAISRHLVRPNLHAPTVNNLFTILIKIVNSSSYRAVSSIPEVGREGRDF